MRNFGDYTELVEKPEDFIRFDLTEGIPLFQRQIKKLLKKIPLDTLIHYPSANHKNLKQLLANWLHVNEKNISITNGSDELIEIIATAFLSPSDSVLIPIPSFFRFEQASLRASAVIKKIKFSDRNKFEWDKKITGKIVSAANNAQIKLIWLASPNNPTGVDIPPRVLEKMILSKKIIILDKTLNGFTEELQEASQFMRKNNKVIILSSLSKTFGLPGLRFGFAIGSPSVIKAIEQNRLPFNIPGPTLWLAENILRLLVTKKIKILGLKKILQDKQSFENKLKEFQKIELASKSNTNFLLLRPKDNINLFEEFKKRKILVANLNKTDGIQNKGFIRLTIRTKKENSLLIRALKDICD